MRPNPSSIRLVVCAALGIIAVAPAAQAAPVLPNGVYLATINPTPKNALYTSLIKAGKDGAWNSSFSFSKLPKATSQGMEDNATDLTLASGTYGSSKLGDGAGSWTMTVNGGTFTALNFQVDAILTTAGGTFVQYGTITGGTITQTGTNAGAMTLDPTGRKGAVGAGVYNAAWNISSTGTTYAQFTTGSSTNADGTLTGHGIVSNGNGTYNVILVSASDVGTAWGTFATVAYVEAWNVNLKPLLIAVNDPNAAAQPGVAQLIDVEANDTIGTGVTPTIVLPSSTSANGAALTVSAGKVSYTASSAGTDTFKYELNDSKGDTTPPATVTVTVAAVVKAVNDTASTPEDQSVIIPVLKNDSGLSGATVTATSPVHGSVTVNSSNQVVYTPTPDSGYVGTDTFSYTATVGGKSSTATVTVTVKAGFQAPTSSVSVGPGAIALNNKTSGRVTTQQLVAAGIPADSGVSSQCIGGCFDFWASVPAGGQVPVVMLPLLKPIPSGASFREYVSGKWQDFVTGNGDSVASALGSKTSCPPPSSPSYQSGLHAGDYCVQLTIIDGGKNDSDGSLNGAITDSGGIGIPTGTGTVVVTAVNDTASTPEGQPVPISVLANDSGVSGATVKITTTSPANGSVTVNKSNQVVYTPNSGYVGTDTFSYTATVGGSSSTATVTVTVKAAFQSTVSVGPGAIATSNKSSGLVTTQQLTAAKIASDSGVSQQCIGGCFDFKATGVGSGGQAKVVMLPLTKPIPSGASFREYVSGKWQDFVTSNGDSVASAPGTATSCPPLSSPSYKTGLVAGDYCVRLTITDGGKNDGDGSANGTITGPGGIATGTGTSGTGTGTPATVKATPDTASTAQGKAVSISVLANDSGVKGATVKITTTSPANGSVTVNKSNQVVYTPKSGFVGKDTFQYTATVGSNLSTATVTVTVKAAFQAATSGVSVGPGAIAAKDGSPGLVTIQQLTAAKIPADSGVSSQCIGGCFDFKATGVKSGGQAKVVMLPLTKPIPSGAKLRKYISGKKWQDFVTSNGDSVASALGSTTSCPPASSSSYKSGLAAGDYCVRLAITDGGPNDSDGSANGVITDPSGIATGTGSSGLGSGGCALGTDANPWHGGSWWIIGGMIGWLGFTRRRRSSRRA